MKPLRRVSFFLLACGYSVRTYQGPCGLRFPLAGSSSQVTTGRPDGKAHGCIMTFVYQFSRSLVADCFD